MLRGLGVSSRARIALLLGYQHPGSLARLCRALTGAQLGEMLEAGGADLVLRTLRVGYAA